METPSADVQRDQQRRVMRRVMQTLWEHLVEHEDAPEGLELFEWRTLPQVDAAAVEIAVLGESGEGLERVTIPRWRGGTVKLTTDKGVVDIPWWAGYDRYRRIAVICCGPR